MAKFQLEHLAKNSIIIGMKRKENKKEEYPKKSMKELTKDHGKAVKGKKENENHFEDFEDLLKESLKDDSEENK